MTPKEYLDKVRDRIGADEKLKLLVDAETGAAFFAFDDGRSYRYIDDKEQPEWWQHLPWDFAIEEHDESAQDTETVTLDIPVIPRLWELP